MAIRIVPSRRRCRFYLIAMICLIAVKIPWIIYMRENPEAVISSKNDADIMARRRYLLDRLMPDSGIVSRMPFHLPAQFKGEWAMGTYSMTSAALANIAFRFPETRADAVKQIHILIERTLRPELREFDSVRWSEDPLDSLDGPNGHIGYLGHLNWMLAAYFAVGGEDAAYRVLFDRVTRTLIRRLGDGTHCTETYPGEIYVPDNVVVVASIAAHSRLNNDLYRSFISSWLQIARSRAIDPSTGLLAFHALYDCTADGEARGSGAAWNSFYLPSIDSDFAAEQYAALKQQLYQSRLVAGIREYPRGQFGIGDVDSGPVIFGFSPSATGFAVGGAVHARDAALLGELLQTAELVGSTIETGGRRRYLAAPLVGEAIMLAMKTAYVWDGRYQPARYRPGIK